MNINKLKQLRNYIAEQPEERVYMDSFFKHGGMSEEYAMRQVREGNVCGTAGCIAGHATMLAPLESVVRYGAGLGFIDFEETASRWLGGNEGEMFEGTFPAERRSLTSKEVALRRLDFAIKNGGQFNLDRYLDELMRANRER